MLFAGNWGLPVLFPEKEYKKQRLGYLSCLRFLTAPLPQINHAFVLKSWVQFHIQGTLVQNPLYFCSTFTGQLPKTKGTDLFQMKDPNCLDLGGTISLPRHCQQRTAIPLCYSWPPPTQVWSCILDSDPACSFDSLLLSLPLLRFLLQSI